LSYFISIDTGCSGGGGEGEDSSGKIDKRYYDFHIDATTKV
jgi:hypothetical protein